MPIIIGPDGINLSNDGAPNNLGIPFIGAAVQTRIPFIIDLENSTGIQARLFIPAATTVRVSGPDNRKWDIATPGVVTFSKTWTELSGVAAPAEVRLSVGVLIGGVVAAARFYSAAPPVVVVPEFVFLSGPTLSVVGGGSAIEGTQLNYSPSTWTGVAGQVSTLQTSATVGGTFVDVGALPNPVVVPAIAGSASPAFRIKCVTTPANTSFAVNTSFTPAFLSIVDPDAVLPAETPFATDRYSIPTVIYRPAAQTTTFTPIVRFTGLSAAQLSTIQLEYRRSPLGASQAPWFKMLPYNTAGDFYLVSGNWIDEPGVDQSVFADNSGRFTRLRFRHRFADNQEWSAATLTIDVPLPDVIPTDRTLLSHTSPGMATLRNKVRVRHYFINVGSTTDSYGANHQGGIHYVGNIAASAFANDPYIIPAGGGFTAGNARSRLTQQLEYWTADTTESRLPGGRGGYAAQYEAAFVGCVAIARLIPEVWDELTPLQRERLTIGMIACGMASCFCHSDNSRNNAGQLFTVDMFIPNKTIISNNQTSRRSVRGFTAGRDNNPNYSTPPKMIPPMVDLFFRADGGAGFQPVLNSFTRAGFNARMTAAGAPGGGMAYLHQTWTANWTLTRIEEVYGATNARSASGPGPDELALQRSFVMPTDPNYRMKGFRLNDHFAIWAAEVERIFAYKIAPGLDGLPGGETAPAGSGWPTGTTYGYKDAVFTKGILRATFINKASWAGVPNKGEMFRHLEMDTGDAGNPKGGGGLKVRAAVSYCCFTNAVMSLYGLVLAAYNVDKGDATRAASIRNRYNKGMIDQEYIFQEGWYSYAKGGYNGSTTEPNNEDFTKDWALGVGYLLDLEKESRLIVHDWLGQ